MSWFLLLVASLFTLYVGIVNPVLASRRYQIYLKEVPLDPGARSRYYWRNVVSKWLWLVGPGIVLLSGSIPASALGLRAPYSWGVTLLLLAEVLILIPIGFVLQRRIAAKRPRSRLLSLLVAVKELLPVTPQERLLWLLVSIAAGVCEEVVFRGFLPLYFLYLGAFLGMQVSYLIAMCISTVLFGFAHLYQGWKGMLAMCLLGALLAYIYIITGSLILPIVLHILIDARILLLAPVLLKSYKPD